MKSLQLIVFLFLVLSVRTVASTDVATVVCGFNQYDAESGEIWVGVFTNSSEQEMMSGAWSLVSSQDFELEVPVVDEVLLVAVRKDSEVIVKRFNPQSESRRITFDLQAGKTLQGQVLSSDGHSVPNAVLTLELQHQLHIPFPQHLSFEWKSDSKGRYTISGLTSGEHEISVVARPIMPVETFQVQIDEYTHRDYDFNLMDAYYLKGRVVKQDGEQVSSARVSASNQRDVELLESTDAEGRFHLGPFRKGTSLRVQAWHDEHGSTWGRGVTVGGQDLLLRLSGTVRILGVVSDAESGEPIQEFVLKSQPQAAPMMESLQSDSDGRLSVPVDKKTLFLVLDAPGYVWRFWQVSFSGGGEYDLGTIALNRGKMLSGVVFDAESLKPIEGARVMRSVYDQLKRSRLQEHVIRNASTHEALKGGYYTFVTRFIANKGVVVSGADGTYSLGPLPYEDIEVQAYTLKANFETERLSVGASTTSVDIGMRASSPLSPATRVRGRLVTTKGEPAKGSIVARNLTEYYVESLRTDANGEFEFPTIPGLHELFAKTDVGRTDIVKVNVLESATADVQLVVNRAGRLIVLLEGLEDGETASLSVEKGNDTIQEKRDVVNGEVLIEGIPVGDYKLTASTTASRSMATKFAMVEQDGEANAKIAFRGLSRLSGKVLDGGSALPLLRVRATPQNPGLTSGWSPILDDGSYEIGGLDDGEYSVSLRRLGTGVFDWGEETEVERKPNVNVVGDTVLDISMGSFSIEGTVNPVDKAAGAIVQLHRSGEGLPIETGRVDVRGRFQFVGLTVGDHVLTVGHRDFWPVTRTISVMEWNPEIEVLLEPRPTGSLFIVGSIESAVDPSVGAHVRLTRTSDNTEVASVTADEEGNFRFENVISGDYTIEIYQKGAEPLSRKISVNDSMSNLHLILKSKESRKTDATSAIGVD